MIDDVFEKIEIPLEEVTVDDVPGIIVERYFTETEFGGPEAYNHKICRIAEMIFGVPFIPSSPRNKRSIKHGNRTNGYIYTLNSNRVHFTFQSVYDFTTYVMSNCFKIIIGNKNLCCQNLAPRYWKVAVSGMSRIASFVYDVSNRKRSFYFTYHYIQDNFIRNSAKNHFGLSDDGIYGVIFQSITKLKGRHLNREHVSYNIRASKEKDTALYDTRYMHCVAMGVALNKKELVFKDKRLEELEEYALKTLKKEDILTVYEYFRQDYSKFGGFGYKEEWVPIYYMGFIYDYEKDFGAYIVFFPKIS